VKFEFPSAVRDCVGVKPKQVRLFVKPYCGWSYRAERWLTEHGIAYEVIDVIANEDAYAEMIELSNQDVSPVIDVDGKILADFGPEQLAGFWNRLEEQHAAARHR
jgi:glutaredoxin